jgi:hypothetical protein
MIHTARSRREMLALVTAHFATLIRDEPGMTYVVDLPGAAPGYPALTRVAQVTAAVPRG